MLKKNQHSFLHTTALAPKINRVNLFGSQDLCFENKKRGSQKNSRNLRD